MIVAVPRETSPGERRVALVPALIPNLTKAGLEVWIETEAGVEAGYPDTEYVAKGAHLKSRDEIFSAADILLQVRAPGANPQSGAADTARLKAGQAVIGFCDPLTAHGATQAVAATGATLFSMELMPRITRAQSMDALSAMATIAGYKAVLLAAGVLPKLFPMLMTAAGTISPAKVFVIGAGVAGLQAISTARRLGAVVSAYDVRPAAREQVQSVGGKFISFELETSGAEGAGGYAKAMDEEFYRRQREEMAKVVAEHDVVITTAAVPGKPSPVLVTKEMVAKMAPGGVIIDLAAERGGNCELTQADTTIVAHGITILGPTNLPATLPYHASQMYARTIITFLLHLVKGGVLKTDTTDEIIRETMVTHGGAVVQERVKGLIVG